MPLLGHVDHEVVRHGSDECLAGARQRGQVGGGPTGDEDARGLARVADPLGEPAEDRGLEVAGPGGLHPVADVDVVGAGDQVAERPEPGPFPRNVGEVAGVVDAAPEGQHVPAELVEDRLETGPRAWQVAGHPGRHPVRIHLLQHRLLVPSAGAVHEPVDGLVPEPAHGLRVDGERVVVHGAHSSVGQVGPR